MDTIRNIVICIVGIVALGIAIVWRLRDGVIRIFRKLLNISVYEWPVRVVEKEEIPGQYVEVLSVDCFSPSRLEKVFLPAAYYISVYYQEKVYRLQCNKATYEATSEGSTIDVKVHERRTKKGTKSRLSF